MRHLLPLPAAALLPAIVGSIALPAGADGAPEPNPVTVRVEQITHPMQIGDYRDAKDHRAMYPVKDSLRTVQWTGPVVTLENGLIEVKIVPTLAMRILNAVDLQTGRSMAGTDEPRYYEKQAFTDVIGWKAGFVEASFPYFEHGTGVRQDAAWRIVRRDDGSVVVAMTMLFSQHQHRRHMQRYGRYSQRRLSSWVTLRPGQKRFGATYRLDNPNPLRRGDRLWVDVLQHAKVYDQQHIIYPVGYHSPHGAGWVKPFFAAGGRRNYRGVSHFGMYPEYRFAGVYAPEPDVNHLVIRSAAAPGMKLYTRRDEGGFLEHWFGSGVVFEDPGGFVGPYEPVRFHLDFYQAGDIGRVRWADESVAVGYRDGAFRATVPVAAKVELLARIPDGATRTAAGRLQPGRTLTLEAPGESKLTVRVDGKTVAETAWPRSYADTTGRHPKVKAQGGKYRLELEAISNHIGAPTDKDAIGVVEKMAKAGDWPDDPERLISLANTVYRYGRFDLADKLLARLGEDHPQADYLRGLIAWERGQKVDFGAAGIEANYHRALLAIQADKPARAVELLKQMVARRPTVYRPRLLLAWLRRDRKLAAALLDENPASAHALLVLKMLGDDRAGKALDTLIGDYKPLARAVRRFRAEITEGAWQHVRRYQPLLPAETN
jgi:hypothetical protein